MDCFSQSVDRFKQLINFERLIDERENPTVWMNGKLCLFKNEFEQNNVLPFTDWFYF